MEIIRTFVTVAEQGSLSEAAKILGRTPSAISMSLKQFTQQLGDELFESDRKSTLTPLGHFVLQESKAALKEFDESMQTINRFVKGNVGTVRIAAVPSVATRLLPSIVDEYIKNSPNVRLELRDIDSDFVVTAVRNGMVDFGIASLSDGSHDLISELLFEECFGVVCRTDHDIAKQASVGSSEIARIEQFISNDLCNLINVPEIIQLATHATIHVHNVATILSFVKRGFGVSILPRTAVINQDDLCFVPFEDETIVRQLFIIHHYQKRLNPAAKTFINLIRQKIQIDT